MSFHHSHLTHVHAIRIQRVWQLCACMMTMIKTHSFYILQIQSLEWIIWESQCWNIETMESLPLVDLNTNGKFYPTVVKLRSIFLFGLKIWKGKGSLKVSYFHTKKEDCTPYLTKLATLMKTSLRRLKPSPGFTSYKKYLKDYMRGKSINMKTEAYSRVKPHFFKDSQ